MLDAAGVTAEDSVIDVRGGASVLVDALLVRGFADVTVLGISQTAIGHAPARLGPREAAVHWLAEDLLTWQPRRSYRVWHDRAVCHFLTAAPERRRYRHVLNAATARQPSPYSAALPRTAPSSARACPSPATAPGI
jgi:hypothetical protein